MLERAYLEITNVCNRSCAFCPRTARPPRFLTKEEFSLLAGKLRPYTDCLYLHVMGEPTIHPELDAILGVCDELRFRVVLTTNGTLLGEKGEILLSHRCLYKVQISLHSFEANEGVENALPDDCLGFAERAAKRGVIVILRLWNEDGREEGINARNAPILEALRARFDGFWSENKRGFCIAPKLYLEYGERFVWPSEGGKILRTGGRCRALSSQIAVLCDGTVVPCCLDGQGRMPLGNLFEDDLETVLSSPLARRMREGFEKGSAFAGKLCSTCGYADRFNE